MVGDDPGVPKREDAEANDAPETDPEEFSIYSRTEVSRSKAGGQGRSLALALDQAIWYRCHSSEDGQQLAFFKNDDHAREGSHVPENRDLITYAPPEMRVYRRTSRDEKPGNRHLTPRNR